MTHRTAKARRAVRSAYLGAYSLAVVLPLWAISTPPSPVEQWAGPVAVWVWTIIVLIGATVGLVSCAAGYQAVERAGSALLAAGLALFAVANGIFDGGDGIRAMYTLGSILSVLVFVPIRWYFFTPGFQIEPRPERAEAGRE